MALPDHASSCLDHPELAIAPWESLLYLTRVFYGKLRSLADD